MILVGVDPGTAVTGFGVVKIKKNNVMELVDYGRINTSKDHLMSKRLQKIHSSFMHVLDKHKPDAVIIEKLFFNTNAKTALSVGQARGIYLLASGQYDIPVFEYTALQAKMEITGYGRADKNEVRDKITEMLNVKVKITPIDAADAIAMAICHKIKALDKK